MLTTLTKVSPPQSERMTNRPDFFTTPVVKLVLTCLYSAHLLNQPRLSVFLVPLKQVHPTEFERSGLEEVFSV